MEKTKTNLKACSFFVIAIGVLSALRLVLACFLDKAMLKETIEQAFSEMGESVEMVPTMVTVVTVILCAIAGITLLINLYIGIRGIGVANGTYKGKALMVWLVIMIVFGVVDIVTTLFSGQDATAIVGLIIAPAILLANHIEMYVLARKIRSAE